MSLIAKSILYGKHKNQSRNLNVCFLSTINLILDWDKRFLFDWKLQEYKICFCAHSHCPDLNIDPWNGHTSTDKSHSTTRAVLLNGSWHESRHYTGLTWYTATISTCPFFTAGNRNHWRYLTCEKRRWSTVISVLLSMQTWPNHYADWKQYINLSIVPYSFFVLSSTFSTYATMTQHPKSMKAIDVYYKEMFTRFAPFGEKKCTQR